MRKIGVCSVTFRKLPAEEVLKTVRENSLGYVEWGGDVHVPAGEIATAESVRAMTADAKIGAVSFGSYARMDDFDAFRKASDTARALGADTIRVWTGRKQSADVPEEEYQKLADTVRRCADYAAQFGQTVAFEFHHDTYSDSAESTLRLIDAVGRQNVRTYWQPMYWHGGTEEEQIACDEETIRKLGGLIKNVHVYYRRARHDLRPLAEGAEIWKRYLALLPRDAVYYLEFVKDGTVEQFSDDARVLADLANL